MVQGTSYTNDQTFKMFTIMTGHITWYNDRYIVPRRLITYIWWRGYKNKTAKTCIFI